jgi:hypothetical protein
LVWGGQYSDLVCSLCSAPRVVVVVKTEMESRMGRRGVRVMCRY